MRISVFDIVSLIVISLVAWIVRQLPAVSSEYAPAFFLGYILVGAYFFGLIFSGIKLPKISGYIIAGMIFGPFVLNIVSEEHIEKLRLIDGVALTLIALIAGGELKMSSIRLQLKSIALVLIFQIVIVFLGVGSFVVLFRSYFAVTADQHIEIVLAVALLLGIIAVANSPATAIAIINEFQARGPMTNMVLGVTILKDVVVLMIFAVGLSVAKTLVNPAQTFDVAFMEALIAEIGLSIVIGILLGVLFSFYLKTIKAESEIFLLLSVFIVAELAPVFHLDALLLAISAGFVVQNFSEQGEKFINAIEKSVLPVFVLFFAIAGASLDLRALLQMWQLAILLAVLRLGFTFIGTYLGSRMAKDPPSVCRYGWTGFAAQAGVSLGLAILIERSFASWGTLFKTLIVAVIAINQILGPVLFRIGLYQARETAEFHQFGP